MSSHHVLRVNTVEEESDFRAAVHEALRIILTENEGATLISIAERIDVTVKTVSNAFNRTHSLSWCFLLRLGKAYGSHVLDPVMAMAGGRCVPLAASTRDILPFLNRAALKVAEARDPASPGGERELHTERLAYLRHLRDVHRETGALIAEIETLSGGRAAA